MKPFWQDNHRTIYCKDCRDMSEIPDNTVQCVVTSPPYWGLRKYSGEQELVWGDYRWHGHDRNCEHEWVGKGLISDRRGVETIQGKTPQDVKGIGKYGDAVASDGDRKRAGSDIRLGPTVSVETLGWQPTCKCNVPKSQSIVLDPFMGAGTTLYVAAKLNRKSIGYELSEEYCELAVKRNRQGVLNFNAR